VGHDVIVTLAAEVEKVEFSRIPMGDDSQADEDVALGLLIESN